MNNEDRSRRFDSDSAIGNNDRSMSVDRNGAISNPADGDDNSDMLISQPPPFADSIGEDDGSINLAASSLVAADLEIKPVALRRREIKSILQDPSLADLDKRLRIQQLMDGRAHCTDAAKKDDGTNNLPCFSGGNNDRDEPVMSCVHYERRCNIVAPCCDRIFGCRICHDESPSTANGAISTTTIAVGNCVVPMDRFAIKEIVCKECHTRQPKSNKCVKCDIVFAEYYCNLCNLWMALANSPFHCADCGFCRVGGRHLFKHCVQCCMCISASIYDTHSCMKDKYKNNCPVCREDMFSSRQSPQDLPCGHAIHAHCFRKLASFDYRCPICKKTVVSQASMTEAWSARARDIRMQPMPPDLARKVSIMCNDCEQKSTPDLSWHFLGVQCPGCNSFNTVVEQVVQQQCHANTSGSGPASEQPPTSHQQGGPPS